MALFFAVLLIFALVAVLGVFAFAMLGQSVALVFQSGTILLIQCTSSMVIFALIGCLVYLVWRQQKLFALRQPILLTAVLNEPSAFRSLVENRQTTSLSSVANQNDLSQFLPDQLLAELPPAIDSWQGKAPWEG